MVTTGLRNKLPRTVGQGTSRKFKAISAISGSRTGQAVVDWSISEFPGGGSFSNWPNQLPGSGAQTAEDVSVNYKFFGLTEALSWLAQFSGQGFEDISALANLVLLQEAMLAEESMLIWGLNGTLSAPSNPTLAARTAASGETANSGVTSNVYVKVTATNPFGETTAQSSGASVAWSSGDVVDVTISPVSGAAQYNIYVTTGTVAGTYYLMASNVGGHKFTLQGALPTSGTTVPTADSGTGASTRYDGLFGIFTGKVAASTYPSGYTAGYINQSVGSTITNSVLADAFAGLWDNSSTLNTSTAGGFRANPVELLVEGLDASNLAANILSQASGGQQAYQIRIDQDELGSLVSGAAVSQVQNPLTRSLVRMVVHPYMTQGTALLMSYQLPMSFSNVNNAFEVVNVQDYVSISWPVIDVTFRYSMFLYGALVGYAPQYSAILQGIQKGGSASGGNWT